jgi:regulator of cell morphogenesis and NO signaling
LKNIILDFCCKGKRSLEQACSEQQLSISKVTEDLENIFTKDNNSSVDFEKMNLTQLADYIVQTHHAYVKNEMPQIHAYLQKGIIKNMVKGIRNSIRYFKHLML